MEAKMTWQGGLNFDGTAESGFHVPLSAKKAVGGDEQGFIPMELLAMGLAGCTAMDVISILQKKRQAVTAFEVQVHARRASDHPRVFTQAVIEYHLTGKDLSEQAVVRSIELSATRYCPAQAMFSKVFPIQLTYHIYEESEDGERSLVKSGHYTLAPDRNPQQS